jgi:hypothetical protein
VAELLDWLRALPKYDVLLGLGAVGLITNALVMFGIQGRIDRLLKDLEQRGVL